MIERRGVSDGSPLGFEGRITARTWSVGQLRGHIKQWPLLTDEEKLARIRQLDDDAAEDVIETHNLVVDGLLRFIVQGLDPTSSESAEASHLALGTSTDTPATGNESLGNEVYRTAVGDADRDGFDLITSTFVSQAEANGETITEIGLCGGPDGSDPLLTHALLGSGEEIDKNSQMVVTIDYTLELRRP